MDNKGVISIEYLFSLFIIIILATGLLFSASTSIMSANDINDNVNHRLILDSVANSINQVNANGAGYSKMIDLPSEAGYYEITVEKNRVTMKYDNKEGESLINEINIDSNYRLHSGKSYTISKSSEGKMVIT